VRLAIVARRAELLEGWRPRSRPAAARPAHLIVEDLLQEGAPERIAAAALAGWCGRHPRQQRGRQPAVQARRRRGAMAEAMTLNFTASAS
jgi:hypothetical protein